MWRILLLSCSFIMLFLSLNVLADTVTKETTTRVIVTPAPQPKEVVVVPQGYQNCFTVAAGWYKGIWVPEHQVCQYADQTQGTAWVQGYWSCDKYNENNDCTNWLWVAGHWVKTLEVY
jgi:hypothetical protein